jgi:hypothetical protein
VSDLPRGWTLSNRVVNSGTAAVTVPGINGVLHVLDSVSAKIATSGAASLYTTVLLNSSDTVYTAFVLGELIAQSAAGASSSDSFSLSGLDLAATAGAALTITFYSAAIANTDEFLIVQGHDV